MYPIDPTGYGPRSRLFFDGTPETDPTWEIRFINYLYTLDNGVHKAILQPVTGVDDDDDFDANKKAVLSQGIRAMPL